jgi:molybdopterin-guanine dinucleotide biosynthesis protein A
MGTDKALLRWGSGTLLDHALERLRGVTEDVHILCGAAPRYADRGVPVHADTAPDLGPLGGLAAALAVAGERPALLLAVDLPFVTVPLLRFLAARSAGADVVAPRSPGGLEPLCAVYGPGCAVPVAEALRSGQRKMTAFWPSVAVDTVDPAALAAFGDAVRLFRNVNDPRDYAAARGDRD